MTLQVVPTVPEDQQQRYYAERLIADVTALEYRRNLTVYERDARMVARWLLASLGVTDLRSHEPPRNSGEGTAVNGPMPLGEKDDASAPA